MIGPSIIQFTAASKGADLVETPRGWIWQHCLAIRPDIVASRSLGEFRSADLAALAYLDRFYPAFGLSMWAEYARLNKPTEMRA